MHKDESDADTVPFEVITLEDDEPLGSTPSSLSAWVRRITGSGK